MKRIASLLTGISLVFAMVVALGGCGESKPSMTEVLDSSSKKMKEVKTARIDYDLDITMSGDFAGMSSGMTTGMMGTNEAMSSAMELSFGVSGSMDVDSTDPANTKARGNIELEGMEEMAEQLGALDSASGAEATAGMDMITDMFAGMEMIIIGDKAYLKIQDTWYETDAGSASSLANVGASPGALTGSESDCVQKESAAPDHFLFSGILENVQELSEEKIDGTDTRHFKATLDTGKLIDEMVEVLRDCNESESATALEESKSEMTDLFQTFEIELWVDKDNYTRQMRINLDMDLEELAAAGGSAIDAGQAEALQDSQLKITGTIKLSNFGQQVDIQAPANPQPLENLVGNLMGLGGLSTGSMDLNMEDFDTITIPEDMMTTTIPSI